MYFPRKVPFLHVGPVQPGPHPDGHDPDSKWHISSSRQLPHSSMQLSPKYPAEQATKQE